MLSLHLNRFVLNHRLRRCTHIFSLLLFSDLCQSVPSVVHSIFFPISHKMRHAMRKTKAQHGGAKWRCLNRLVRWFRDVRDIRACKEILWNELDQDRDETESLRTLTTVAANGLYWYRKDSSANVKMWHRLPGAPLRNRVKGCNQKGHFDSGRVAGCPPPSCSAWQLLRGEQFVIWPRMPDLAE